jgi:hypothetical protein
MDHGPIPKPTLQDDPTLAAEVEHAIAPYRGLVPPEMLDVLRDIAVLAYTEHPAGQRILDRIREINLVESSGVDPASERIEEPRFQSRVSGIHRRGER